MAKNKTTETQIDVTDFINSYVENNQKILDSFQLITLMKKWSGFEPKIWGSTIIGFGNYHYKYESGHEGNAPIIAFSPRKAAFSLYVFSSDEENKHLLEDFGKFKMKKACIYINKLADINIETLEKLCRITIAYINEHHKCPCRKD